MVKMALPHFGAYLQKDASSIHLLLHGHHKFDNFFSHAYDDVVFLFGVFHIAILVFGVFPPFALWLHPFVQ